LRSHQLPRNLKEAEVRQRFANVLTGPAVPEVQAALEDAGKPNSLVAAAGMR
jgi:hypothetical protein